MTETFEDAVVREFRTGRVVDHDLSRHSICDMTVMVAGRRVEATWYPPFIGSGSPRSVTLDGRSYPEGIARIVRAAQARAKTLVAEEMAKLDALVNDPPQRSKQPPQLVRSSGWTGRPQDERA